MPSVCQLLSAALAVLCVSVPTAAQSTKIKLETGALDTATSQMLRPGDIIRLRIWREPDMSGDFPVDERGRANLPLLGTVLVLGQSREALRESLVNSYRTSIQNLAMDVLFLRRIAIIGAVRAPGLYPMDPTMTIGDAVALAGGGTVDADRSRILVMRGGQMLRNVEPSLVVNDLDLRPGDQILIPERGWLARNPWAITTFVQAGVSIGLGILTLTRK